MAQTIAQMKATIKRVKERDNKRDIHINDEMVVVSTNDEGFLLMHVDEDAIPYGNVYKVKLEETY